MLNRLNHSLTERAHQYLNDATTRGIMTFGIMTFSTVTFFIMTFSTVAFSITTFGIPTFSTKFLFKTFSLNDFQHK